MSEPQKYRSKGRIFADILRAMQEGPAKVTHILYRANLSHDRLTRYLAQLEESGLVARQQDGDKTSYAMTEKGSKFLVEFRRMEEFADAFGLDI